MKNQSKYIDVSDSSQKKYKYQMKKMILNKDRIKNIELLHEPYGHARYIRSGKVKALLKLLENGEHFESPLVFERQSETYFLTLDGGHRLNAMKQYFKKNKDATISFYCAIYDFNGLPEEEKKKKRMEIFTKWNIGTRQSTDDFISTYRDVIPNFNIIAGKNAIIPCTIYGAVIDANGTKKPHLIFGDTIKLKSFVGALFESKKPIKNLNQFSGGYSGSAESFVKQCQEKNGKNLTEAEVKNLFHAWSIIKDAYYLNPPYNFKKSNGVRIEYAIARTTVFNALMQIVLTNMKFYPRKDIIVALRKPEVKESIIQLSEFGGRTPTKACYKALWLLMNKNRKRKDWFVPIITLEEKKQAERDVAGFLASSKDSFIKDIDEEEI